MSRTTVITPDARDDIDDAYQWYEGKQAGSGDDFLDDLRDRITQLGDHPEQHGRVHGETRAAPLTRHKYIIYYRVEPDRVVVIAVQHASADPRKWQRRK